MRLAAGLTSLAMAVLSALPVLPQTAQAAEQRIRYFHPDHLGSTALVTDENGNVIERVAYKPFGEVHRREVRDPNTGQLIVGDMSSSVSPYGFTGQRHDASTGLYFYGGRYYDPQLGRFIQPDTVVQDLSDPQFLNRYSYVRNNPVNMVDPTGNFAFLAVLGAMLVKAAIGAAIGAFTSVALGAATGQIHSFKDVGRFAAVGAATGTVGGVGAFAFGAGGLGLTGIAKGIADFGTFVGAGALGGGIDSEMSGGSFGQGALYGAALGGAVYGIGIGFSAFARTAIGEQIGDAALGGLKKLANSSAARAIQGALGEALTTPNIAPLANTTFGHLNQAAHFLKESGLNAQQRRDVLSSFVRGGVRIGQAIDEIATTHYFRPGRSLNPRYHTPLPVWGSPHVGLALPNPELAVMPSRWVIQQGATLIYGPIAPNFGSSTNGGLFQIFIQSAQEALRRIK